jgi:type VI protein secretion system component Hcp
MIQSGSKGAATMTAIINRAESSERDRQAAELTEIELSNVTGGAGAGKVTFHLFSITKHVDKASPVLFL